MTSISPYTGDIKDLKITNALEERYLSYALSTILSRSLPDVRDGLKPVHRRLLFAMRELKLNPKNGFKKCARVVGDVIGKYHPHGDVAVYETLVRLAQDFSLRYPLIEGQGNFGNIDGDNPAAMRYTEARLTELSEVLMEGLDQNAADFKPTYDGSEEEPVVFPCLFPNLLANGSNGIAVGMATSIPPHNLEELIHGLVHLISNPGATVQELVQFIKGPDFPTGGILVESQANILQAYETGKGSFRLRAAYEIEQIQGGSYQIVITQIPYQVQKTKLIQKIADIIENKKIPLLIDIRDESSEDIRIILIPKTKQTDPLQLMESLFKQTELEVRYPLNMNVVDGMTPKLMSLKEVLQAYLNHRLEVLVRVNTHRLSQINNRLEILNGLLIVYLNLDEIIRIIREEDEPKQVMMEKWSLSDLQAESILNTRLRSLRKLEEIQIRTELEDLLGQKEKIEKILSTPKLQWKEIEKSLTSLIKKFGKETPLGKRRSLFSDLPEVEILSQEMYIEKEQITIILSHKGWIRSFKGHEIQKDDSLKYKEGDSEKFILQAYTTDKIIFFSNLGKSYTLVGDKFPKGRGFGESINLLFDFKPDETAIGIYTFQEADQYLIASDAGRGFMIEASELLSSTKNGKNILSLDDQQNALCCLKQTHEWVATIAENRKILIFNTSDIPKMQRGKGVTLQKMINCKMNDIRFLDLSLGLKWKSGERIRHETDLIPWTGKRAQTGRLAPTGFPRSNRFDEMI
jgi:topoisomerase-4 subunit A